MELPAPQVLDLSDNHPIIKVESVPIFAGVICRSNILNANLEPQGVLPRVDMKRLGKIGVALITGAVLPIFMLFIFGFSIKTTPEYRCVIQTVTHDRQVVAITGEPVSPGFFAWTGFFESGGGVRQGSFSTRVSGPAGAGTIQAQFYRTPLGEKLGIWFKAKGDELTIYDGDYPCR